MSDVRVNPAAVTVPRRTDRARPWRKLPAFVFAGLVYLFLYSPILVMVVFSFNDNSVQNLPLKGFTTDWYQRFFDDKAMVDAVFFSVKVSLIAVLISAVFGTGFAIFFNRVQIRGKSILEALIALPFVMPGMVLGVAMLLSLKEVGVRPGMLAIVIGHVVFITPIILFIVGQRLRTFDVTLEHASKDLGAGTLRTFINITFPSIRTSLLAAALLGFTISFDEIIVTFFLAGSDATLPVYIWTLLRQGFSPAVNAALTLIAAFSICLIAAAAVIILRSREPQQ